MLIQGGFAVSAFVFCLVPLVQHVNPVANPDPRSFQLGDRGSNSSVRQVVTPVVVKTDDQNTGMVASGSDDQFMQVFEVFRIVCQNREALGNREDEHSRIRQGP